MWSLELVENLVHLEGGQDRLDQDGRLDRAALQPQQVFWRASEHVASTGALRGVISSFGR